MKLKILFPILMIAGLAFACGGGSESGEEAKSDEKMEDAQPEKPKAQADPNALADLTAETAENKTIRDDILICLNKELDSQKLPHNYKVTRIKSKGEFAFVTVDITNPDGSQYNTGSPSKDCCEVGVVMQAAASQWVSLESAAFATDVWWACAWKRHNAPREIFPDGDFPECNQ